METLALTPPLPVSRNLYSTPSNNLANYNFEVVRLPADDIFVCQPYNKKGIYKISIHQGHNRVHYAGKVVEIKERAILFSRPNMIYRFEPIGKQHPAYLCVFTIDFFDKFANIASYPLFDPEASPIMEITQEQLDSFTGIFQGMEKEIVQEFGYKYDVIRTLVLQLILDGLKQQPAPHLQLRESNSAIRITGYFKELLEGQFPIINPSYRMILRHPLEFADSLSVHVNHLNRSLKQVTGRTTTQLIADRIIKEAKVLLQDTEWNIMEIAWSLGFEDFSHFVKFFRKSVGNTPSTFRKNSVV